MGVGGWVVVVVGASGLGANRLQRHGGGDEAD